MIFNYNKIPIILFLIILSFDYAHAQVKDTISSSRQLKEVVVTAEKQVDNIQDIPGAVSYINDQGLVNQRISVMENLKGLFPNLYLSQPGDGRNVIGIRGVVTTSYEPAVAVYVDGVLQYNLDTYFDNLHHIKRIEVLRGPQGTLYGRNAMGGVINIITKKPTNKLSGYAGIKIGNYGLQRYKLGLSAPIIPGKLFFGLSGMYKKSNGFYENKYTDAHYDKNHALLGNYYLKYLTTSNWEFMLNYKHSFVRNHGAFALAPSIQDAKKDPFFVNQDAVTKMKDEVSNASFSIQHKGNRVHFSSQTTFQSNHRIYEDPIDGDFSPLDIVSIVNNYGRDWNKVTVWTQEFKVSSVQDKKDKKFSWTAGLFGFTSDNPVKQGSHFGKKASLYGSTPNTTLLTTNKGLDKGWAVFGQAEVSLSQKIDFTLGLRYDWEKKQLTGRSEFLKDGKKIATMFPDSTANGTYHAFSPKAILSYNLDTDNLLYLSFARGFRAGGISDISGDPSVPPLRTYDPEYSNNFELGVKNEFLHKRMRWNVDIFYTLVNHVQIPQLIMPQALTLTKNVGKVRSMGIESELTTLLGKHFQLIWNGGITHAEFTKLSLPGNNKNEDFSGNKQLYTPEYTSNLMVQYKKTFGQSKSFQFHARAEWLWFGTTYFDMKNTLKQNPYSLINSRVGVKKGHVSFNVWAKNIFNTLYVDYAYNFGAAHLGNPATFGVSVDFRLK